MGFALRRLFLLCLDAQGVNELVDKLTLALGAQMRNELGNMLALAWARGVWTSAAVVLLLKHLLCAAAVGQHT